MAVAIPFYRQQTVPSGGVSTPRARGQEIVAPDLRGIAGGLNSIAEVVVAEERKAAHERKVLDDLAAETRAIVAQSTALNDLEATVQGIKKGLQEGSIDKEKAFELWKNEAPKTVTSRLEGLDPNRRARTNAQLLLPIGKMSREVLDAIDSKNRDDVVSGMASYLEGMERYALTDPAYALQNGLDAIVNMGPAAGLGADDIQAESQKFREKVSENVLNNQIALHQDDPAVLQALQTSVTKNQNLSPEKATILFNRIQTHLDGAERRREAELKLADAKEDELNALKTSDLAIRVSRGEASYWEVEQGLLEGWLKPTQRTEFIKQIDRVREKEAEAAQKLQGQIQSVQGAIGGERVLDFRSDADRDAVDAYVKNVVAPTIQDRPAAEQIQALVDLSGRIGIVPSQIKGQIRGMLRAGGEADKVQAADFLDRLKGVNPQVINDFTQEDISLANRMNTFTAAGATPKQAVDMAEAEIKISAAEKDARLDLYRSNKATQANEKLLSNELASGNNLFSPDMPAEIPDAMRGEFEATVRAEYLRTGALATAQKTAKDILMGVWGVTNIGGKRWMKYAPEVVYQVPGEDGTWIAEQLETDMREGALVADGVKFSIQADSMTARQKKPSYQVLMIKDGAIQPVLGKDNLPVRFQPNYATSAAGKRREREANFRAYEDASNLYIEALKNGAPKETLDKLKAKADAAYERTNTAN